MRILEISRITIDVIMFMISVSAIKGYPKSIWASSTTHDQVKLNGGLRLSLFARAPDQIYYQAIA